jgi:hypothetical protein
MTNPLAASTEILAPLNRARKFEIFFAAIRIICRTRRPLLKVRQRLAALLILDSSTDLARKIDRLMRTRMTKMERSRVRGASSLEW